MRGFLRIAMVATAASLLLFGAASRSDAADPPAASDEVVAGKAAQLRNDGISQVFGNPNGDVVIVEFFDYVCPFCKAVEPRLQDLVKADKNVKIVIKEFPILTPQSLIATKAALAAVRQGKYEAFHHALMAYRGRLTEQDVFDTAKTVGLNIAKLKKDMEDPKIQEAVYANLNLARSLRIFQTPTFIVNNHIQTEASASLDFPKLVAAARATKPAG